MINTNALKGKIAEHGITQGVLADRIGISRQAFSNKMHRGVFGADEIDKMVKELNIQQPLKIFFIK